MRARAGRRARIADTREVLDRSPPLADANLVARDAPLRGALAADGSAADLLPERALP
ncbi:hypothetical protein OPKNFCMD_0899 [Methylobacterium crusticola]|uniref:Uncharacterized protein n=1 Tax=Methylobacterium crusticola TaxID=1697972 RepID=A0ABQ4QS99_9HYPH|nr:hypothetical protein [Methylobacterium crusticola]GJD48183.1 hypothetical protein OPKNFCMD_0899 [Methylobacterium crusticola]